MAAESTGAGPWATIYQGAKWLIGDKPFVPSHEQARAQGEWSTSWYRQEGPAPPPPAEKVGAPFAREAARLYGIYQAQKAAGELVTPPSVYAPGFFGEAVPPDAPPPSSGPPRRTEPGGGEEVIPMPPYWYGYEDVEEGSDEWYELPPDVRTSEQLRRFDEWLNQFDWYPMYGPPGLHAKDIPKLGYPGELPVFADFEEAYDWAGAPIPGVIEHVGYELGTAPQPQPKGPPRRPPRRTAPPAPRRPYRRPAPEPSWTPPKPARPPPGIPETPAPALERLQPALRLLGRATTWGLIPLLTGDTPQPPMPPGAGGGPSKRPRIKSHPQPDDRSLTWPTEPLPLPKIMGPGPITVPVPEMPAESWAKVSAPTTAPSPSSQPSTSPSRMPTTSPATKPRALPSLGSLAWSLPLLFAWPSTQTQPQTALSTQSSSGPLTPSTTPTSSHWIGDQAPGENPCKDYMRQQRRAERRRREKCKKTRQWRKVPTRWAMRQVWRCPRRKRTDAVNTNWSFT